MKNIHDLPPHPAAALFPMMTDAELRDLADDIKEHGEREPISLLAVQKGGPS